MSSRGSRPGPASWLGRVACLLVMAGGGTAPALAALPAPAEAYAAELARIEAYLNDLGTLRSEFVQINPDGGMATGKLYYQRPDKMRLDYDPPTDILIIADGWGQLVYHDRQLEQTSHLFVSSTPLGFLLDDQIRLSGDVTVTAVEHGDNALSVTLIQTDEPNEGSIRLTFTEEPLELRRWTVIDPQGLSTYVVLEAPETGLPLDGELFRFRDPDFFPPDARN